eukprot:GHVN01079555.1.p1 GENE.GHVN01079555.1~~GHVN01079555.1.p1  ORF type:complete len:957 (+),score=202.96 GHVN01079555.1:630-3500(+)
MQGESSVLSIDDLRKQGGLSVTDNAACIAGQSLSDATCRAFQTVRSHLHMGLVRNTQIFKVVEQMDTAAQIKGETSYEQFFQGCRDCVHMSSESILKAMHVVHSFEEALFTVFPSLSSQPHRSDPYISFDGSLTTIYEDHGPVCNTTLGDRGGDLSGSEICVREENDSFESVEGDRGEQKIQDTEGDGEAGEGGAEEANSDNEYRGMGEGESEAKELATTGYDDDDALPLQRREGPDMHPSINKGDDGEYGLEASEIEATPESHSGVEDELGDNSDEKIGAANQDADEFHVEVDMLLFEPGDMDVKDAGQSPSTAPDLTGSPGLADNQISSPQTHKSDTSDMSDEACPSASLENADSSDIPSEFGESTDTERSRSSANSDKADEQLEALEGSEDDGSVSETGEDIEEEDDEVVVDDNGDSKKELDVNQDDAKIDVDNGGDETGVDVDDVVKKVNGSLEGDEGDTSSQLIELSSEGSLLPHNNSTAPTRARDVIKPNRGPSHNSSHSVKRDMANTHSLTCSDIATADIRSGNHLPRLTTDKPVAIRTTSKPKVDASQSAVSGVRPHPRVEEFNNLPVKLGKPAAPYRTERPPPRPQPTRQSNCGRSSLTVVKQTQQKVVSKPVSSQRQTASLTGLTQLCQLPSQARGDQGSNTRSTGSSGSAEGDQPPLPLQPPPINSPSATNTVTVTTQKGGDPISTSVYSINPSGGLREQRILRPADIRTQAMSVAPNLNKIRPFKPIPSTPTPQSEDSNCSTFQTSDGTRIPIRPPPTAQRQAVFLSANPSLGTSSNIYAIPSPPSLKRVSAKTQRDREGGVGEAIQPAGRGWAASTQPTPSMAFAGHPTNSTLGETSQMDNIASMVACSAPPPIASSPKVGPHQNEFPLSNHIVDEPVSGGGWIRNRSPIKTVPSSRGDQCISPVPSETTLLYGTTSVSAQQGSSWNGIAANRSHPNNNTSIS